MSAYPDRNLSNLRHRIASYQMKKAFLTAKRQSEETINREYESAETYAFDEAETNVEEALSYQISHGSSTFTTMFTNQSGLLSSCAASIR